MQTYTLQSSPSAKTKPFFTLNKGTADGSNNQTSYFKHDLTEAMYKLKTELKLLYKAADNKHLIAVRRSQTPLLDFSVCRYF